MIDIRDLDPQLFMISNNPHQVIYAMLAGSDETDKRSIIREILIKLQSLLAGSEITLQECIVEMEYLAQVRGKRVQHLLKQEVNNMAITLDVKKSLYYQEAIKGVKKEGRKEGKMEDAELMLKDGMTIDLVRKYTRLNLMTIKAIEQKVAMSN
jgi:hypothetical protein